jgi:hypothetical protein
MENSTLSKHEDQSGPIANTDPDKRGRGGDPDIGQKIPKKVLDKIQPKQPKNGK